MTNTPRLLRQAATTFLAVLVAVVVSACGAGAAASESSTASTTSAATSTTSELTREQMLSADQTPQPISEQLTEDGEAQWSSWAQKLLTEDYIHGQIDRAQERAGDADAERVAEWNGIVGQDGLYRQAIAEVYGEAGTALYDQLADVCYLFLLDPAAANYSVFEAYVQEQAHKADATASIVAPPTSASNPYFSDNTCRLLPVPVGNLDDEAIEAVFAAFLSDNPQYYFVATHGTLSAQDGKTYGLDLYVYAANKEGARYQEVWDAVKAAQAEYHTADWDSLSEIEKYRAIYDWLAKHVEYDFFAAGMVSDADLAAGYPDSYLKYVAEFQKKEREAGENYAADADYSFSQTVWSVFVNEVPADYPIFGSDGVTQVRATDRPVDRYTVCAGYSAAFTLLSRMEELEAICFSGGGHAWNRAKIDGAWCNIDCTWDDPASLMGVPGLEVTYQYFARSDKEFYDNHEVGESAINNFIITEYPGTKDYPPYEHYYHEGDTGWAHGYYDGNKLVYLEEDGQPKRTASGEFETVDVSASFDDARLYADVPGYVKHDDSIYPRAS